MKTNIKKVFYNLSLLLLSLLLILSATFLTVKLVEKKSETAEAIVLPESTAVAKKIAHEGMILLKNDYDCLPLRSNMNVVGYGGLAEAVYVAGENTGTGTPTQVKISDGYVYGGGGSGWVSSTGTISPKVGLENALTKLQIASFTHYDTSASTGSFDRVIYIIVRTAAEDADLVESNYYLTDTEKTEITNLINHYGKNKVCVLLNTPNVIDTTWLIEKDVGAILQTWLAGQEAGNAIADVLTAQVTPSGKTTDTWAKSLTDYVTTKEYTNPVRVRYEEDLYIGYRWFETFDPTYSKVNYEFGYGLSYTSFDVKTTAIKTDEQNEEIKFYVTVTNTGSTYSGKEVVQVYYSTPNDVIDAPAKQLIAYDKTTELAPGASENLVLTVDINEMAQFDDLGVIQKDAYVLQAGKYNFYVGNSIKTAGQNGVVATYTQGQNKVTEQCSTLTVLATSLDKRLTSDGTYEILNDYNTGSVETHYVNKGGATIIDAPDFYSSREDYYQNADLRGWWYNYYSCQSYFKGNTMNQIVRHLNKDGRQVPLRYKLYVADTSHKYNLDMFISSEVASADLFDISIDYTPEDGVDNGVATGFVVDCPVTEWNQAIRKKVGQIEFTQTGYCLLTIKAKENCGIDYISLYDNTIAPDEKTEISAEAYASKTDTGNPIYEELGINGYCVSNLQTGNFVEWNVYAQAGTYYLSLNLASPKQAFSPFADIYVNGTVAGQISTKRTSANPQDGAGEDCWWSYKETPAIKVTLQNGENKIKLQVTASVSDGGTITLANLNKLIFRPESMGDNGITYSDNTADYAWISSVDSPYKANYDRVYTYEDVIKGNISSLDYVKQFNIWELGQMAINPSHSFKSETNSNVGGFGGIGPGPYTDSTDPNFPDSVYNNTVGITSTYGMPYGSFNDGPAGTRFGNLADWVQYEYKYATYFPCMTMLASSWNDDLAYEFGVAYGNEAAAVGVSVSLMPGVNIHRNPLCGRNFEYYSEDPFLSGWMAANVIKGVQSTGAGTSIKHFALNNQETGRFFCDSRVSVRALREIYLEPFRIAITNSNPVTVMSSYNQINGSPAASNYDLLTTILRGEWGYEGIVVSDWGEWHYDTTTGIKNGGNIRAFGYSPLYLKEIVRGYQQQYISYDELAENAAEIVDMAIKTNAQAIANNMLHGNDYSNGQVYADQHISCVDGNGTTHKYLTHSVINTISKTNGIVAGENVTGAHGTAKLETNGNDSYLSNLDANSGAYYSVFVEDAGDYYISYLLNINGNEGQYGNFKLVIDGKVVDTFTNPSHVTTAPSGDWLTNEYMTGDNGQQKVYLSAGMHRVYLDANGSYFNIHNITFTYGATANLANGNGIKQGVSKQDGAISTMGYTAKTGDVKIEGDYVVNSTASTLSYEINVLNEGTYQLSYLLNIGDVVGKYGNFDILIDNQVVDTFTNTSQTTTSGAFTAFNGNNGGKTIDLTKGAHVVKIDLKDGGIKFSEINLTYEKDVDATYEQTLETELNKKINGAALYLTSGANGGLRYQMQIDSLALNNTTVNAILLPASADTSVVDLTNYASYGGTLITPTTTTSGNSVIYTAEFKNIASSNFNTQYVVKFVITSTVNNLTVTKSVISDSRSCRQVAEALSLKGTYSANQLAMYLQ